MTLLLGVVLCGCSQTPILQADRVSRPLRIDGVGSEGQGRFLILESGRLAVAAALQDKELVLTLRSHDPALIQRFARGGFTLWLDPKGRHKKSLGLHFPGARSQFPPGTLLGENEGLRSSSGSPAVLEGVLPLEWINRRGDPAGIEIPAQGAGSRSRGDWFAEFSISLSALGAGEDFTRLGVGIIANPLPRRDRPEQVPGLRPGRGPGRGNTPGKGYGPHPSRPGRGGLSDMDFETWVRIELPTP